MAQLDPAACSVFVQVFVDTGAASPGSQTGIYMVDNRGNDGSTGQGTASLNSVVSRNSYVCFEIINVDVTSTVPVTFESFGNSNAWGTSGQPAPWAGNKAIWTGQVENSGLDQTYEFIVSIGGAPPIQVSVATPTLSVSEAVTTRLGTGTTPSGQQRPSGLVAYTIDTAIVYALDAQFLISQPPGVDSAGVYPFDNRIDNGSTGEGSTALNTHCNVGDQVSFQVGAINQLQGYTAVITGFDVSAGNVFSGPPTVAPIDGAPTGSVWVGTAANAGTQTYLVYAQVADNLLHPVQRDVAWSVSITSGAAAGTARKGVTRLSRRKGSSEILVALQPEKVPPKKGSW